MDNEYNNYNNNGNMNGDKPLHIPSMVLMIIGAVFALILPIVTYPCSIISLVMSVNKRNTHKTTYAIVINIIALVVALINSILGVILQFALLSMQ